MPTEDCRITLSEEEWRWLYTRRPPVDPMGVSGPPPVERAIERIIREAMRREQAAARDAGSTP